jgi:hypothetical protein
MGGQNSTGRYHLNKQMGLPKFGPARNPFATEVKSEATTPCRVATEQISSAPTAKATRTVCEKVAKRAVLVARVALMVRRSCEWLARMNPFLRTPKPVRAKKSAIPRFKEPPVQSELCLDNVHVVRNDLSDADLEVVPIVQAAAKPELATDDPCDTAGKSWGRLTVRMSGSNHT